MVPRAYSSSLEAATGKEVWKVNRPATGGKGESTPTSVFMWEVGIVAMHGNDCCTAHQLSSSQLGAFKSEPAATRFRFVSVALVVGLDRGPVLQERALNPAEQGRNQSENAEPGGTNRPDASPR